MPGSLFCLIGDLVGSRRLADRSAAQRALGDALATVNHALQPAQPLEPTLGDEYQGGFDTLAGATRAALLVRLTLLPVADTRCGIGFGEVVVHDADRRPVLQDGPGWWAAREAIETLAEHRSERRSWYVGPGAGPTNAFLTCRDQLAGRLNERGLRILRLALLGHTQREIAAAEEVTASAVSQQFARGVGAIVDAQQMLEDVAP